MMLFSLLFCVIVAIPVCVADDFGVVATGCDIISVIGVAVVGGCCFYDRVGNVDVVVVVAGCCGYGVVGVVVVGTDGIVTDSVTVVIAVDDVVDIIAVAVVVVVFCCLRWL